MNLEIRDLQKADIFVQCFQHIKTFTETINIVFEPDQMFIQCMDSTMVLIMEFKLPSSWFDVYEVDQPIITTEIRTRERLNEIKDTLKKL